MRYGLLAEFGLILPTGIRQLRKTLPEILSQQEQWDDRFMRLLCELSEELKILDERVARHDGRLQQAARDDIRIKRLLAIEGMGPVVASALVAAVGDGRQFKSGREMAAYLGLVPGSTPAAERTTGPYQQAGGQLPADAVNPWSPCGVECV
jgi:transposase